MIKDPQTNIKIYLDNVDNAKSKDYYGYFKAVDHSIKLDFRYLDQESEHVKYLIFKDGRLSYHFNDQVISFDWLNEYSYHKKKQYRISKEPLAKSLKIKGGGERHIADLTCGTGKDAMLLLSFGAKVTLFERNPIVYLLAFDALRRLENENVTLFFGSIQQDMMSQFDALYYDPMYPEKKKKSAKARKEMEVFKEVVGADEDHIEFLKNLIESHAHVVIKRPMNKGPLFSSQISYSGKTTRYDLYLNHLYKDL